MYNNLKDIFFNFKTKRQRLLGSFKERKKIHVFTFTRKSPKMKIFTLVIKQLRFFLHIHYAQ